MTFLHGGILRKLEEAVQPSLGGAWIHAPLWSLANRCSRGLILVPRAGDRGSR